jgi:zinc D-Ala-D-Ala carboxypeptidase
MLSELVHSDTAARLHLNNNPSAKIIAHLQQLCVQLLEPIREEAGSLKVSSGFREDKLNTAIGSHSSSAHPWGWAADINAFGMSRKVLVDKILSIKFKFDQVIFEGTWVHVGLYQA